MGSIFTTGIGAVSSHTGDGGSVGQLYKKIYTPRGVANKKGYGGCSVYEGGGGCLGKWRFVSRHPNQVLR